MCNISGVFQAHFWYACFIHKARIFTPPILFHCTGAPPTRIVSVQQCAKSQIYVTGIHMNITDVGSPNLTHLVPIGVHRSEHVLGCPQLGTHPQYKVLFTRVAVPALLLAV